MSAINASAIATYFGIDGKTHDIRSNCKTLFHAKVKNAVSLRQGEFGSVSEVCNKSNCKFVAKALPLATAWQRKMYYKEAQISRAMGEAGLAPKIHDTFICLNAGFIIMEKMDGDLRSLLKKDDHIEDEDLAKIGVIIRKMHRLGVIHNDLHSANVLYMEEKNKKSYFLTDFGLALRFTSPQEILPESEIPNSISPNIFFPAVDYHRISVSIEANLKTMFESYYIQYGYMTLLEYVLVEKYYYWEPHMLGNTKKPTFLEFLQKQPLAHDMIRTLPSDPEEAALPVNKSVKKSRSKTKTKTKTKTKHKSRKSKSKSSKRR